MPAVAAPKMLSVLELRNKLDGADKKAVDAAYVSDRIRAEILELKLGLQVMTRENMLVLLESQGRSLENCEGECEVETGRRLGADYVISGELLRVGPSLKATLKFHDTQAGTLLGAVSASGVDVEALDGNLPGAVKRLTESVAPARAAAPPAAAGPSTPAAVRSAGVISMKVAAPPDGKWRLQTADGSMLCELPCTQRLARGEPYYAVRDADRTEEQTSVPLPRTSEFAAGRSVEASYVASRGSSTAGLVLAVLGLGAGAVGAGVLAARSSYANPAEAPPLAIGAGLVAGGAAVALTGVVLLLISHDEHYEAALARGQARVHLDPRRLALAF